MSKDELAPIDVVKNQLAQNSKAIQSILPPHIDLAKFQRITFTAIQKTPALLGKNKLLDAVLDCAKDGLIPDGREAALVPFGNEVAYMPMVAGILKKIRQSGELKSLSAQVVHANAVFDYWLDEEGVHFKHKPTLSGDPGEITGVYAVAVTKDDGSYFEFLNMEEVKQIKGISKSSTIWNKWPGEMMKKTAIRRLAKRLPMSTDIESTITQDDKFYSFDNAVQQQEKTVKHAGSNANDVKKELNKKDEEPEVKPPKLDIF